MIFYIFMNGPNRPFAERWRWRRPQMWIFNHVIKGTFSNLFCYILYIMIYNDFRLIQLIRFDFIKLEFGSDNLV